MDEKKSSGKDKTTKILIALVALMFVTIAVLGFLLYDMANQRDVIFVEKENITLEKENIKAELTALYDEYSSLETNNDSLNTEILKEKERITILLDELQKTKNYNYSMKKRYENEISSLKSIMRHYVYQIDSLDQYNKQLIAENITIKDEHTRIKSEMDEVVEKNDELSMVIENAAILKTTGITTSFLNRRGREARKASKIEKIKVSFTIVANDLANAGADKVYLRIIRPDNFALSNGQTLVYREKNIAYSAARDVIYENQDLNVSIFYDVHEELTPGRYNIELYMGGNIIGESSFLIEK